MDDSENTQAGTRDSTGGAERGDEDPTRERWQRIRVIGVAVCALVAVAGISWLLLRSDGEDTAEGPTDSTESDLSTELIRELSLTPEEAACVAEQSAEALSEDEVRSLLDSPEEGSAGQEALDQALADCSLEEEAPAEVAAPGSEEAADPDSPEESAAPAEPSNYGDAPELDALWDRCAAEGTDACDELYNQAPAGSAYEAFADTCGDRGNPQVACAPDALAPGGEQPGEPGTPGGNQGDQELDRLYQECDGGDAQSCLTLAFQAPAGSEYAEFGASCGNRPDDERCQSLG